MKIVLMVVLISSFSYLGFQIGGLYLAKEKFYSELIGFITHLISEISFLKTDLMGISTNFKSTNKHFNLFLNNLKNKILFEKDYENITILNEQENLEIKNFINSLGKNDALNECEIIKSFLENFKLKLNDSREGNKKYGIMYKKLGVLVGILVCIVLI